MNFEFVTLLFLFCLFIGTTGWAIVSMKSGSKSKSGEGSVAEVFIWILWLTAIWLFPIHKPSFWDLFRDALLLEICALIVLTYVKRNVWVHLYTHVVSWCKSQQSKDKSNSKGNPGIVPGD